MNQNEIRDYIERAPKKWRFDGGRMINSTHARLKWLCSIAQGTLDEKINRRAGIDDSYKPWKYPVGSSIRRNYRNQLRKRGLKSFAHRL